MSAAHQATLALTASDMLRISSSLSRMRIISEYTCCGARRWKGDCYWCDNRILVEQHRIHAAHPQLVLHLSELRHDLIEVLALRNSLRKCSGARLSITVF